MGEEEKEEFDEEFWEDAISQIGGQRVDRALDKVTKVLSKFAWKFYMKALERGFNKEQAMQLTKVQSAQLLKVVFTSQFGRGGAKDE